MCDHVEPLTCDTISATVACSVMIVIKVANSSSVVASRIGRFLADLTPSGFDQNKVEDELMKQLVEQLAAQGIQGEVAAVRGMDLHNKDFKIEQRIQVRRHQFF
ncbi:hypothetical protein [Synechococcus sp. CCFWC 502]|uniref:hypothetical protein n=2 Tax=unclassified Synechococcus TaxID=2626047 RepID=UPI00345C6EAC